MRERPQNGIAGLKHWRYDLLAGMQVALVSLPLSLGIAIASGVAPITGVISAIIAGLVFPFLGGAYVTISGPAAGLAPVLLAAVFVLGEGDLAAGYPLLLVAIFLTGVVQIVLSVFQAGKFVATFLPATVVEAMLAAIGVMIIIKQVPALVGNLAPPPKDMLIAIAELPKTLMSLDPAITAIGIISLALMFLLQRTQLAWLRRLPPALFVCIVGIALGYVFALDPKYLISMPGSIVDGVTFPDFGAALGRPDLWTGILMVVVTLVLVDGIESLATIKAVDKIDPFQRVSNPNITLRAMGVSNALSSVFGGLTIIPGGIKSRTNIDAGGRTLWANFYNAVFLLLFLFFAKDLITRIPLAAIGAVLVYVGWRLCEPRVFAQVYAIGRDKIAIFVFTVFAVLATDLLSGIVLGVAVEIALIVYLLSPSLRLVLTGRIGLSQFLRQIAANMGRILRSPVVKETTEGSNHRLSLGSVTGFNLHALEKSVAAVPPSAGLTMAFTESGRLVEHAAMEYMHELKSESLHHGRSFTVTGLEGYKAFTNHPLSARMRDAQFEKQKSKLSAREKTMSALAAQHGLSFEAGPVATLNPHDFVYLRRGANREERNVVTGTYRGCEVRLHDYIHTAPPEYHTEHRHTLIQVRAISTQTPALPNLAVTPGHYLERYLVEYRKLDIPAELGVSSAYRVYGTDLDAVRWTFTSGLAKVLRNTADFYFEVRNGMVLAFRPGRELEDPDEAARWLFAFADFVAEVSSPVQPGQDSNKAGPSS